MDEREKLRNIEMEIKGYKKSTKAEQYTRSAHARTHTAAHTHTLAHTPHTYTHYRYENELLTGQLTRVEAEIKFVEVGPVACIVFSL